MRESTRTENKKLAERIYGKTLAEVEEDRWFENQAKKKTLKEMIDRYQDEYSSRKDYYQSRRDKSVFKHLYSYFGEGCTLKEIELKIGGYEKFRMTTEKPAKPSTVVKELGVLRRMFNVARKQWKWKIGNPVSDIELPKVRNERVRYLTDDERRRLFEALVNAPQWLRFCVVIALGTGLRLSNVCNLKWG